MKKIDREGIMYFHGEDENENKFTLAASYENGVHIGAAICSAKDNFCKRIGRQIAVGRSIKKPISFLNISNNKNYQTNVVKEFIRIASKVKTDATLLWKRNIPELGI